MGGAGPHIEIVVQLDHRRVDAGAEALDLEEGEEAVLGGLCAAGAGRVSGGAGTVPALGRAPPLLMPAKSSMVFLISSDPHTMHGVVPQSWMKNLPTGLRLNMV